MDIKITGIEELDKKLREFDERLQKRVIKNALVQAAQPVLDDAISKCPIKTGALVASIKLKDLKRNKRRFGCKVEMSAGDFKGNEFYGSFLEYGYLHNKRGYPNRPKIEGKGFMRRAWDLNKDKAKELCFKYIKENLMVEVGKLEAKQARAAARIERAQRKAEREQKKIDIAKRKETAAIKKELRDKEKSAWKQLNKDQKDAAKATRKAEREAERAAKRAERAAKRGAK
jgi:hypothetical protein